MTLFIMRIIVFFFKKNKEKTSWETWWRQCWIVTIVLLLEAMAEIIRVDDKSGCMIYDEEVSGSKRWR